MDIHRMMAPGSNMKCNRDMTSGNMKPKVASPVVVIRVAEAYYSADVYIL